MKRLITKYSILPLLFSGALAGCVKDNAAAPSGGETPVTVFVMSPASRAGETSDPKALEGDYDIVDFRVMVFKYGGGDLIRNTYVADIWDTDPENRVEILDIMTGVYDFLFIANEKAGAAGGELHTRLDAYDPDGNQKYKLADVLKESFPYTDFSAGRPIPMTALYRSVAVSGDNTLAYTEDGEPRQVTNAVWPVQVQRLGVRLDLKLKTNIDVLKDNITGLTIRVPRKVYLVNDKSGSAYAYPNNAGVLADATAEITIPYDGTEGVFTTGAKPYVWTLPRIVLPENTFNPFTDEERAVRIGAHFDGNLSSLYGSVTFDREGGDYTAPRNYIYSLTGFLNDAIRFDGTVVPWDEYSQPETDLSYPIFKLEPESNCYVVEPDSDPIGIPVSRVADSRLTGYIDAGLYSELSKLRADVLWSDTPGNGRGVGEGSAVRAVRFVNQGTLAKSYILATPGNVDGNSVVILYKDSNGDARYDAVGGDIIVYSWHIWVSGERLKIMEGKEGIHGTTGEPLYWMDRNLGAKYNRYEASDEAGVMGFLYQYGRKDPFPASKGFSGEDKTKIRPVYGLQEISVGGSANIAESIRNPFRFYSSAPNWFSGSMSNSVWFDHSAISSDTKSIFDPCPHGWSIPRDIPWGEDDDNMWSNTTYGFTHDDYGGYYPYALARAGFGLVFLMDGYWSTEPSSEPTDTGGPSLNFMDDYPGTGTASKTLGLSIRCVKSPN